MADVIDLFQICPKCDFEQPASAGECARCGVVFSKLESPAAPYQHPSPIRRAPQSVRAPSSRIAVAWEWLIERSFNIPDRVNPIVLGARGLVWVGLFLLSWGYILSPIRRSQISPTFIHFVISRANLVFHEAGHIIFGFFGELITAAAGTATQVLVPLICAVAFLRQLNAFGAAVATWWAGQSLIDSAPYINDARAQQLVLLGGVTGRDAPGYHDWNNVLSRLGLLAYDHTFAKAAHLLGSLLIVLALVWGGYQLVRQYRNRETFV